MKFYLINMTLHLIIMTFQLINVTFHLIIMTFDLINMTSSHNYDFWSYNYDYPVCLFLAYFIWHTADSHFVLLSH